MIINLTFCPKDSFRKEDWNTLVNNFIKRAIFISVVLKMVKLTVKVQWSMEFKRDLLLVHSHRANLLNYKKKSNID